MKPETHPEFGANEVKSENDYSSYKNLGGIINEGEYKNALAEVPEKMKEFKAMSETLVSQSQASALMSRAQRADIERLSIQMTPVKGMAELAGISLEADEALERVVGTNLGAVKFIKDPRAVLFTILRGHTDTVGEGNHHSQMSDQELFAEVLRMSGDEESLAKFTAALPNIFGESKE